MLVQLPTNLFSFLHNYSVFFIYLQNIIPTDYIPTLTLVGSSSSFYENWKKELNVNLVVLNFKTGDKNNPSKLLYVVLTSPYQLTYYKSLKQVPLVSHKFQTYWNIILRDYIL